MDSRVRWWPPLAAAVLLAVAALSAALSAPRIGRIPLPAEPTAGQGQGTPTPTPSVDNASPPPSRPLVEVDIPPWVGTLVAALFGLVAVVIVGLLLWYLVRDTIQVSGRRPRVEAGEPAAPVPHADEVVAAHDAGLADLSDLGGDPRRAVIACWVRLERAAADAGTPREPGDAPADLVRRLLDAHRVSRPVLDRFAAVYREARYATHVIDEHMRATAVDSLRQLRAELAGAPL